MASKYKGVTKAQMINVLENVIRKLEATEITLNLLVSFVIQKLKCKDDEFDNFMKEKLGGTNGPQADDRPDRKEDNTDTKENA